MVFPGATSIEARKCRSPRSGKHEKKRPGSYGFDRLINVYSYHGRTPVIIVYAATMIAVSGMRR
jgi:hypothetical protein